MRKHLTKRASANETATRLIYDWVGDSLELEGETLRSVLYKSLIRYSPKAKTITRAMFYETLRDCGFTERKTKYGYYFNVEIVDRQQQAFKAWVGDCIEEGGETSTQELHESFTRHSRMNLSRIWVWLRMGEHGFKEARRVSGSIYLQCNIKASPTDARTRLPQIEGKNPPSGSDTKTAPHMVSIWPEDYKPDGGFWTPEQVAKAKNMRRWKAQWSGLHPHRQFQLSHLVFIARGRGMSEEAVEKVVQGVLAREPSLMSDKALLKAL